MSLTPPLVLDLLLLLLAANGSPVLAKRVLGARWNRPLDGGRRLADGRPLFGASKTWRGVLLSVLTTALLGPALGYALWLGAAFAIFSMTGDLLSSFLKRRFGVPASGRAMGLDQIPEALLPLLALRGALGLGWPDLAATVALFTVGSLLLSRLLFRLGVKDEPY